MAKASGAKIDVLSGECGGESLTVKLLVRTCKGMGTRSGR